MLPGPRPESSSWYVAGLGCCRRELIRLCVTGCSAPLEIPATWRSHVLMKGAPLIWWRMHCKGSFPPEKRRRLASSLFVWSQSVESKVSNELSFRARTLSGLATRVVPPKPDVGAEFDALVSRNPQVGVRILEQALRQRRLSAATSRATKEEISRKKWILELASVIREAGLPAAARIDTMSNPEAAWIRAFGSRRAKTLKNRVLAWRKLGSWLQVTYSVNWPSKAELVLQYLEERYETSPLGKTVPGGILSTLGLLELVGQVEPSERLSEDTLLIEAYVPGKLSWSKKLPLSNRLPCFLLSCFWPVSWWFATRQLACGADSTPSSSCFRFWATLRVDDLQKYQSFECYTVPTRPQDDSG